MSCAYTSIGLCTKSHWVVCTNICLLYIITIIIIVMIGIIIIIINTTVVISSIIIVNKNGCLYLFVKTLGVYANFVNEC